MKKAITNLQRIQKNMVDNMYPGYPYQDSIIIDLETNKAYDHYGDEYDKDTLLKDLYDTLLYRIVGHSESTKPTWLQDRKIASVEHFTDSLFDNDELYIDCHLSARLYLAIQSALCYAHDNEMKSGFIWACIDCDCDYIDCQVFKDEQEVLDYVKDYIWGDTEYSAEYTILINGSVYGKKDYEFTAESDTDAIEMALAYEEDESTKKEELLLDYIYDKEGNEIEWQRK